MFCLQCGGENRTTAKFCKLCGTSLHEELLIISCPTCGQLDKVKKISALYENIQQKSTSKAEDLFFKEKIAPPKQPKTSSTHPLWWFAPFLSPINVIAIWFAPMSKNFKLTLLGSAIITIGAWVVKFQIESHYTGSMIMLEQELPHMGMFTLLDLPFITMFILLCTYYIGLFQEQCRRKRNLALLPPWEKTMNHWNKLFYCPLCNGVFRVQITPGEKTFAPVDDLKSLL